LFLVSVKGIAHLFFIIISFNNTIETVENKSEKLMNRKRMYLLVNDDSEESDRPKRKKSRSMWGDSDSEDSDNSWRQRKKK